VWVVSGELLQDAEQATADVDLDVVVGGAVVVGAILVTPVLLRALAQVGDLGQHGGILAQRRRHLLGPVGEVQPGQTFQNGQQVLTPVARPGRPLRPPDGLAQHTFGQAEDGRAGPKDGPVNGPEQPLGVCAETEPFQDILQFLRVPLGGGVGHRLGFARELLRPLLAGVGVEDPAGSQPGHGEAGPAQALAGPGDAVRRPEGRLLEEPPGRAQQRELPGAMLIDQNQRLGHARHSSGSPTRTPWAAAVEAGSLPPAWGFPIWAPPSSQKR
jgi:hypothetical protein